MPICRRNPTFSMQPNEPLPLFWVVDEVSMLETQTFVNASWYCGLVQDVGDDVAQLAYY